MLRLTFDEYYKITKKVLLPKRNKMGNQKTADGYDSKLEQSRAKQLQMEQKLGLIQNLEEQKIFILQEKFEIPSEKTKTGKEIIRAITYKADFVYNRPGEILPIVEDTKGHRTEAYKIKRKLFIKRYQNQYKFIETGDKCGNIKK